MLSVSVWGGGGGGGGGKGGGYDGLCIGLVGSFRFECGIDVQEIRRETELLYYIWGLSLENMMNDWRETGQEKSTCAAKAMGPGDRWGMLEHAWCIRVRPMGVDRGKSENGLGSVGTMGEGESRKDGVRL